VVQVPTAGGGLPDLIVDDPRADRLADDREQGPAMERASILRGYESAGEPIEDNEGGA
jgi:hypothetical protein